MNDDIHIRRVRQLVAPVLTGPGGLLDELDDLYVAARMLDTFDDAGTGLSRSELLGSLRTGQPLSDHALELLFDKLCELEWLVQVRGKAGTQRWRPCALALTSAELLLSLSERSAADRLVELIVLALDRLDDPDLTQDGAADITRQLTRNVNLVAADLEAALVHGTLPAMQAAMPSARALTHVSRVSQLVQVARRRSWFPSMSTRPSRRPPRSSPTTQPLPRSDGGWMTWRLKTLCRSSRYVGRWRPSRNSNGTGLPHALG